LELRAREDSGDRLGITIRDNPETCDVGPEAPKPSHRDVLLERAPVDVSVPGLSDEAGRFLEDICAAAFAKELGEDIRRDHP